jgi:hypothetical protein
MAPSDETNARAISGIRRALNFAGGVFTGLVLVPLGGAITVVVLVLVFAALPTKATGPEAPFELAMTGADVSRAGGVAVEVRARGDALRLDCRDACDDLRLQDQNGDLDSVRVLDANGACVACRDVSQPYSGSASRRWSVSGTPKLAIAAGGLHD